MLVKILEHKLEIVVCLFALSEILALIPSIKANSVFQLCFGFLKKEKAVLEAVPEPVSIEEKKAA